LVGASNLKARFMENYALSWSFWYLVYNNDMLNADQLKLHFNTIEQNPALKNICDKYEKELNAVTSMIAYYNQHPCIGFWYTYWNDLHKNNSDLPGIKNNDDKFNPAVPTSICFKPMGRKDTEAFLATCEGEDPLGSKQSEHLDRLFGRVDEIKIKHPINDGTTQTAPATTTTDPASTSSDQVQLTEFKREEPIVKARESKSNGGGSIDGGAVWVDFAKNPVAKKADPDNISIVAEFNGSAVWAEK
jgi:hypothetical protein